MVRYTDMSEVIKSTVNCGHSVQVSPCDNLHRYERHFHETCELLLLVTGDVHYNVDGNTYALKPYDIILIPPSTYHFLIPVSNEDYESYVINVRVPFVGQEIMEKLFTPPYIINISDDSMLRRMFARLDFYFENFSLEDFKKAGDHLVSEILISLCYKQKKGLDEITVKGGDQLIGKITRFISENLEGELNADIVAKNLNFSRSYVQNRFSEVMGIGLKQYINQKKIYAAHADIQGGLSPNEAARKYSFEDYSGFYRQYKKILGVSPKNWK